MNNNETEHNSIEIKEPSIGRQFVQARRSRGISVRQVSEQIKLPGWVIEALENDEHERIAPVFLRGYIRHYAKFLGLASQPLLADVADQQSSELRSVLPVRQPAIRLERWFKLSTYLLVTTLIVPPLIYFFVVGGVAVFEHEVVSTSVENESGEQSVNVSERIAQALAAADSSADPTNQDSSPMSASTIPLAQLRSNETVQDQPAEPVLETTPEVLSATLVLEMSDDSWVEIQSADGQRLEFDLLRAGMQREYQAEPPFTVLLGRASAVQIELDGQPVAFPGHDQASVAEFELGLNNSAESAPSADSSG